MDVYVSILLGLPQTLHDIDIDQDQPLEVDDDYITTERLLFMPPGRAPLMAGFNAHNRMVTILSKVVEYVYPIKADKNSQKDSYIVSHAKIREIENDLKQWTETLPEPFRPGSDGPKEYVRIQHILRMAYAHIQMFLYRPFLHYASLDTTAKALDKTSFACAAACVSVSRNIVHLTGEMNRRGLLVGSFWFYNYTTFFAIIGLVFYVLENPHSATSVEVLKDAREGKDTLLTLASKSLAADRCSKYLSDLFDQLSPKLNDLHVKPASQKKRQNPSQSHRLSHGYNNAAQLVADANTNHLPQMNTSAGQPKRWDQPSYPFNLGINASYPNGTQGHYLPTPAPIQTPQSPGTSMYTNTTTGPGGRGFSAMMFPSADPFAYPNQPLTTLDNQQQIKQEEPIHPSMFNTESSAGIDQSIYFSLHFLQPAQGEAVTERVQSDSGLPTGLRDRLSWALELELSMRGAGFVWSSADVRHTKRTWRPSVRDRVHSIVVHMGPVLLVSWAVIRGIHDGYLAPMAGKDGGNGILGEEGGGNGDFDGLPYVVQGVLTATLGAFLLAAFSLGHSVCAILLKPLAPHPLSYFPSLYTKRVWEITSVRDFWSYGWHRLFSRLFLVYGVWPGEWVERKLLGKGEEQAADVGKVLGAFVSSGFVHSFAGYTVVPGGWRNASGEAWFFTENGVAVIVEEAVRRAVLHWRKRRGNESGEAKGKELDRWQELCKRMGTGWADKRDVI
ncbi:uncharacterized protein KY384_000984 [Bacidia gigantensis]|uniref:uncharacterized protein n=1 Tax=Bacidia gigantensis TaxID=2732470 RepID=UPI001D0551E5|nr:uncharacterized protein KY384_000984 [Bacidia gigantensis]KAG8534140.1 hypothetical protein KY384_000984 [Bacidia gigantensis]